MSMFFPPALQPPPPACYRSLSGPSGPKCPGSVPRPRCLGPGPQKQECPKSVPRVSRSVKKVFGHSGDTLGTRFGHSGARGPKGPRNTPKDTPGTLRARKAREAPVAGRGGCNSCNSRAGIGCANFMGAWEGEPPCP